MLLWPFPKDDYPSFSVKHEMVLSLERKEPVIGNNRSAIDFCTILPKKLFFRAYFFGNARE